MSISDFLTVVSIFADVALIITAASKMQRMSDDFDNRPVVMSIFIGIAMLIMHGTYFAGWRVNGSEVRVMSWLVIQLGAELTIIRLIGQIPYKK